MTLLAIVPAMAETLRAGKGQVYPVPSAAIAAAHPGDTVAIDPGTYFDCAIVAVDRLTIEGAGAGATLTDKTCQGKAILVTSGRDIVLRNLTLTRARVVDRNGAGVRAEGVNLLLDHVRFVNNEEGILAASVPDSTIRIIGGEFRDNGRCVPACAHAIYVGQIAVLHVEGVTFIGTRTGHHIKSRAARTEIVGNDIADGPEGSASYLVDIPDGGDLLMLNNRLEKGPKAESNHVVVIGAEQRGDPGATQAISGNTLTDDGGPADALVLNWGAARPVLSENNLPNGVAPVSSRGAWPHRIHVQLYRMKMRVIAAVNFAKHGVRMILSIIS